jgi:hypothetical protein
MYIVQALAASSGVVSVGLFNILHLPASIPNAPSTTLQLLLKR